MTGGARPGAGRPPGVRNGQGRKHRVDDLAVESRLHTKAALDILLAIMNDESAAPTARFRSARTLLEYGWGSPAKMDRQDVVAGMA